MATFRKLKTGYRAEVCVKGVRKSKIFATSSEAKLWAAQTEIELAESKDQRAERMTVSDLLDAWQERYLPARTLQKWESNKINQLQGMKIASVRLSDISPVEVSQWRDERLKTVSEGTVNREWNFFSGVFSTAVDEMGLLDENPFKKTKRPPKTPPRTRIPTLQELALIEQAVAPRVWTIAEFAIQTGMRAGEIVKTRWENVHEKHIHLPAEITKTRTKRDVPLSIRAREILNEQPRIAETVFPISSASLEAQWRKGCKKAMVEDLHFHDLRALAATNWSKKLTPLELAKMLGHKDLSMLMVYYRDTVQDIADKLG